MDYPRKERTYHVVRHLWSVTQCDVKVSTERRANPQGEVHRKRKFNSIHDRWVTVFLQLFFLFFFCAPKKSYLAKPTYPNPSVYINSKALFMRNMFENRNGADNRIQKYSEYSRWIKSKFVKRTVSRLDNQPGDGPLYNFRIFLYNIHMCIVFALAGVVQNGK